MIRFIRAVFTAFSTCLAATSALAEDVTSEIRPQARPAIVDAAGKIRPAARPDNFAEIIALSQIPDTFENASSFLCLAVAIYHEARGESFEGQVAVASVILQRAAVPGRWGDSACEVVVPVQFSFLKEDGSFDPITNYDAWNQARQVAVLALVQGPNPWLEGADHYHTVDVFPPWAKKMPKVAQIGAHIFYADPRSRHSS